MGWDRLPILKLSWQDYRTIPIHDPARAPRPRRILPRSTLLLALAVFKKTTTTHMRAAHQIEPSKLWYILIPCDETLLKHTFALPAVKAESRRPPLSGSTLLQI